MKTKTFHVIHRYDIPDEFEDVVLKQMEDYSHGCYKKIRLYNENSEYDRSCNTDLIPITEWFKSEYPEADLGNILVDWDW